MSDLTLIKAELRHGIWEGILSGASKQPEIEVRYLDQIVPDVTLSAEGDDWRLRVPIPPVAIADGVQTVLVRDLTGQRTLTRITLIAGSALEDDLRAEVDLLRAELDLLKRAFRQHCAEAG